MKYLLALWHGLIDVGYRLIERMRDPGAFEAAATEGSALDFEHMHGAKQCLLVSFKRSGEPVPTPVNFGLSDGRLYFRCEPRSGKVKRIRLDPHVRIAPCNLRGRPSGPVAEGRARVLAGEETKLADRALAGNWSAPTKAAERALEQLPIEIAYVEVEPA
jgi:PPOX class probable F420-dependent enzyme